MGSNSSGASAAGLLLVGQQPLAFPFIGGTLLVVPTAEAYLNVPAAGFSIPFTVPDLAALCGVSPRSLKFYVQLLQIDPAAAQGVSFSPGMLMKLGK